MNPHELQTTQLKHLVDRLRAGDVRAQDELLLRAAARLEHLARRMLKGFPNVRRYEEADDVLQGALLRLLRALKSTSPASTREFYGLAANCIRSELIDLARHYYGPEGMGRHEQAVLASAANDSACLQMEPADPAPDSGELDRWCAFHEAVERLPVEEREVFGLVYYHGWKQAQIAELFQVTERTVRRWLQDACSRLQERLGGDLP